MTVKQTTRGVFVAAALLAYSDHWSGPRPATVVNGSGSSANVNVALDGANDRKMLDKVRMSGDGSTFTSVPVYDTLSPEQIAEALKDASCRQDVKIICVWPDAGDAGKADGGKALAKLKEEVAELRDELAALRKSSAESLAKAEERFAATAPAATGPAPEPNPTERAASRKT